MGWWLDLMILSNLNFSMIRDLRIALPLLRMHLRGDPCFLTWFRQVNHWCQGCSKVNYPFGVLGDLRALLCDATLQNRRKVGYVCHISEESWLSNRKALEPWNHKACWYTYCEENNISVLSWKSILLEHDSMLEWWRIICLQHNSVKVLGQQFSHSILLCLGMLFLLINMWD